MADHNHRAAAANLAQARREAREFGHERRKEIRRRVQEYREQEERELLAARQILQVFGEDIDQLWRNEEVQKTLKRLNIRLESKPGL